MPRKFDINEMPSSLTSVGGVAGGASNRQAILQGSVNSTTGVPNFLSIGTGLAVNLSATSTNLIMCFAAGFSATTGAVSYIGGVTADATSQWSGLTASTTNYLYVDRNSSTGALTYGQVTVPPYYQAYAPSTTFSPTATSYVGGTASNVLDGNSGTTLVTNAIGSGYTPVVRIDYGTAIPITQLQAQALSYPTATGTFIFETSVDNNLWIPFGSAFATTGSAATYTQTGYSFARYARLTLQVSGSSQATTLGEIVTTHNFVATHLHWFDTSTMTMKNWSGSVWNNIQRVFVGQVVTGASTVTSVTNYAIGTSVQGNSTAYTFTPIALRVESTGSVISSGATGKVLFSATPTYDLGGDWDTTNHRHTAKVTEVIRIAGTIDNNSCSLYIYKNGSNYKTVYNTFSTNGGWAGFYDTVKLSPGEYVELYINSNGAGGLAPVVYLSIDRIA